MLVCLCDQKGAQYMRRLNRLGCFGGLLLLLGILTGCSLFLPNDQTEDSSETSELVGTSTWLTAAQGQGGPPACVKALPPGQAKKLAEKVLKDKPEIQLLKQALERRGKKLVLSKAHGCKVKGKASGQGLSAQQEAATEATLVEVPAGSDAALYLLENPDDGNEWASLKEVADVGERLVHLEVGLVDGSGVQGLQTAEAVGQMSLVLPDDVGTQEIASDLQQLFSSQATTGAGVSALQPETLDWANAEVVLDQNSVVSYSDGTQEIEAVVVIPEASSTGQVLWGRTKPMIDGSRATFAKVTVKKTPPTPEKPRPTLQVVSPPTQVKKGNELQFDPFDLCPYQHYGRVSPFTKPLCYQWEQQAAPKIQQVTFDRGVKSLPTVHSQALQSTGKSRGGVMAIAGPEGNLIVAGMKNLDVANLIQLYERTVKGQGPQVEGQDVPTTLMKEILKKLGVPAFIISLIFEAYDYWQSLDNAKRDEIKNILLNLKIQLDHPEQFMQEIQNRYNDSLAFRELVDKMTAQLRSHSPGSSDEELRKQAFEIFYNYMSALAQSGNLTLVDQAIDQYGVAVVLAFGLLNQGVVEPVVAGSILRALNQLYDHINQVPAGDAQSVKVLVLILAASAAQVVYGTNVSVGMEGVARVQQFLFELVPQLRANGWKFKQIVPQEHVGFAFEASLLRDGVETFVYGMLEPYLQKHELDAMIRAIQSAADYVMFAHQQAGGPCFQSVPPVPCRFAVVEVINNAEPGAVDALCTRIQNEVNTYVPIVVIGPDGQVACSKNTTPQEAQALCQMMGYCGPSPQLTSAGDEPTTIQAPVPPPPADPACPKGKVCLI